jgi:hypothetical protein
MRAIGRVESELSPLSMALTLDPAINPANSRAVVPELPQSMIISDAIVSFSGGVSTRALSSLVTETPN